MSYTAIHLELKRKRKGVKGIPHLQEQRRKMMKKEVEGLFRENLVVGLDVAHVWTTIIDANDEFQCDYVTKCHPASVYPQDWHFEEECVKSEIRVLQKCSQCVEMGLTPNLPMHYGSCIAPTRAKTRFDKSGEIFLPLPTTAPTSWQVARISRCGRWGRRMDLFSGPPAFFRSLPVRRC